MTVWEFLSNFEDINNEEWVILNQERNDLIKTYGRKADIVQKFYDKERKRI